MKQSDIRKRVIGFTVLGLSIVAVPAVAMASSPSSSPTATTVTTTTVKSTITLPNTTSTTRPKTTTTAKTTTATVAPKTKTYEIIAGTFTTRAAAQKRLTAITAKKITGLKIVQIGKNKVKYRLETTGLTKAKAIAAVKVLKAGKFFAYYVVN